MSPIRERITGEEALERVTTALGDRVTNAGLNHGQVDLTVAPDQFVEVMRLLRDTPGLECTFFTFLSGIDRSEIEEEGGGLEVIAHVYAPDTTLHVNVHVPLPLENPVCPSITSLYGGAQWAERETHEMFGIDFEGHPRLVNLYLPEDFEGHPLLKSFKLPSRTIKEWPGAKDPEEAAAGGR